MLLETIEVHDQLNPKIWNGTELKQDVKEDIINIVNKYVEESEILTQEDIIDVELLGSNASYNYTDNSDLDIHLVVNMDTMTCDPELMQLACNSERSLFNKHFDITIKGIPVQLYVEDVNAGTASNGIYSLYQEEWIKFPQKITLPDYENDPIYIDLLNKWDQKGKEVLSADDSKTIQEYINLLYNLRRQSIMKDGEFSLGNLVFKEIRNQGLLDQLKDKVYELSSKELSLEGFNMKDTLQEKKKTYRVNYMLAENFHYSLMEAFSDMEAAEKVYNYFGNPEEYEFLAVEEIPESSEEEKEPLKGPSEGAPAGLAALLIESINGEWDTINLYNNIAITARAEGYEDIAKVIDDINQEENVHVGQLQEALKTISPNTYSIADGENEGKEQIESDGVEVPNNAE